MSEPITIDEIKAVQSKLAAMVSAFEAQARAANAYPITINRPELKTGEIHVGTIISADGQRREHLILLPTEFIGVWGEAGNWARSIGGELPDRVESALLFAHARDEFKPEACWTREQHAADSYYAWYQSFYYGNQGGINKSAELRARAVRRSSF